MNGDKSQLFDLVVQDLQDKKAAFLNFAQKEKPTIGHRAVIDLGLDIDENAPYVVNFPFRSVFVEQATDAGCIILLKPNTKESIQPPFRMGLRDSWAMDYNIEKCYLHWPKQIGKKMELVFFTDAEFRSGSQISVTSGGIAVSEGISFTDSMVTLPHNVATLVLPVNSLRVKSVIQNIGPQSIWVGAVNVGYSGATRGYELGAGATFEWKNTSALYAIQGSGAAFDVFTRTQV